MCIMILLTGEAMSRDRRNDRRLSRGRNLKVKTYFCSSVVGSIGCDKYEDGSYKKTYDCAACSYADNNGVTCNKDCTLPAIPVCVPNTVNPSAVGTG